VTILPLIARELRVRARYPGTFWARFAVVLTGLLFCLPTLTLTTGPVVTQANLGNFAFNILVKVAFTLSCMAGLLTVNGVSRDRREGTLGLLFLTSVRPLDVLLAGFGSTGISCLCALIALAPLFILPVLAGGVTWGEAARTTLVLFDTICLSVAAGLFASASGRGWFKSARSALLLLAVILFAPMIAPGVPGTSWISPVLALRAAADAAYNRDSGAYWASLATIQSIAWLLLLAAGNRLKRAMREEEEPPAGSVARRFRRALVDGENPILWLLGRQRGVTAAVWLSSLGESVYALPGMAAAFGFRFNPALFHWGGSFALHWIRQCIFAWAASQFLIEARRSGELELLLTTPLGATTLVESLWRSLRRLFLWPMVILLAPVLMEMGAVMLSSEARVWGRRGVTIAVNWPSQIVYMVGTVATVAATIWLGLLFGFKCRSQGKAVLMVITLVAGVPFVISPLFRVIVRPDYGLPGRFWPTLVMLTLQIIIIFYHLCLIGWSWRRLSSDLTHSDPVFMFPGRGRGVASLVYKAGD
jgi:hypothetical protein